jgi:transposase
MERLQAFNYALQPSGEQARRMRRFAGACRFVFNKALGIQQKNHEAGGKFIGYVAMAKQLTEWRHGSETPWLKESPVHPLQHALKDLEPLHSFKKHQQRLKRYQRRMARKVRFSANWKKAKARVTHVHLDIGNARKDYLHKATAAISQNHAIVYIEDLQIRNLSTSSQGNTEAPGKKVSQKSGLNRAILDQGWGEFRRQLDYKLAWWRSPHRGAAAQHQPDMSSVCACVGR